MSKILKLRQLNMIKKEDLDKLPPEVVASLKEVS